MCSKIAGNEKHWLCSLVIKDIQTKTVKNIMQNHFYDLITIQDTQWDSLSWYMYLDDINALIGVYITGVQK
jgi:hypothetical protein